MSFGDVAAAAIRFARDGFPTYPFFAEILAAQAGRDPSNGRRRLRSFCRTARPPAVGEIFVQSDLGRTLQYMADQEKACARGDRIAGLRRRMTRSIAATSPARSCGIRRSMAAGSTAEDLAEFHSRVEPPCRIRFGDFDVYGCGPWSQGPMVLEALNILEGLDLKSMRHNSAAYVHAVTEALKLAAADREVYFGDPDFVDVPLDVLLSKDYAARRRA